MYVIDSHLLLLYARCMNSYYDTVNDWLLVGGDLDLARDLTGQDYATTIAQYRDRGVTHVLDVRSEWEDRAEWMAEGLADENYCHVPIIDRWGHVPAEGWFEAVEAFVHRFWMVSVEGDLLLTNCHMGINRAPSTAMLALLTVDPLMHPLDAFLRIRKARPAAGLVYAEAVGVRHLLNVEGVTAEDLTEAGELPASVVLFSDAIDNYWTPELRQSIRQGIAYYRDAEGGTLVVDAKLGV